MEIQVNKEHYDFEKYVDMHRWNSYYYQIIETMKCKGNEVLLIGIGDSIVVDLLKKLGKRVTTLDFDELLNPDIVGDVTKIDAIINKKYDIILCCQVLEHIPFQLFENTIKSISAFVKEKFILALPNHNFWCKFSIKIPKLKEIRLMIPMKRFWERKWDINRQGYGEHYWEIDAKGYERTKIKSILTKYFKLEQYFVPYDNTYHMFYILAHK